MKKTPIIVVVGPTASGKTALSVLLAKKFDCEIVSFDSMQVYKELSVSTAKPDLAEMDGVPHHLIDNLSVSENFSVATFCEMAKSTVEDIISRNKIPLFVGGTGLYIDSFVNNINFKNIDKNDEVREKINNLEKEIGTDGLYKRLMEVDNKAAENIHPNNIKRVKRALEIYYSSGITKTEQDENSMKDSSPYKPLFIGINYKNRENLYNRINLRVDKMIENGLVNEAREFYKMPFSKTASQAIGCKELKPFIDGKKSLDECVEKLKQETRRYAKRQITWFKRNKEINWYYPDEQNYDIIVNSCISLIENFLK